MADPLGLIGGAGGGTGPIRRPDAARPNHAGEPGSPSFREVLLENLQEVNKLQQDATEATEDLLAGRRDDLEGVIMATQKADLAFRMLQSMRNKVMAAYEEVKGMRA